MNVQEFEDYASHLTTENNELPLCARSWYFNKYLYDISLLVLRAKFQSTSVI